MVVEEALFLYGPKGETLFSEPFPLVSDVGEWNSQMPAFFHRVERSGDDRSYAIISAILVEYQVDRILKLIMPGFRRFAENRDVTFSMKLSLLKSLSLIPEQFIAWADAIRTVRNEFAHDIQVESLEKMGKKARDRLMSAYQDIPDMKVAKEKAKTTRQFLGVTLQAVVFGLRMYESNIMLLVETIRSSEFLEQLKGIFSSRRTKELESMQGSTK